MEMDLMNSISLSAMNAATNPIGQAMGLVMLDKQLETSGEMTAEMVKMMENSVNPAVGSNIDVYV